MRLPHTSFVAVVLGCGGTCTDTVMPLGAFGVGTGVAGLALSVAALPVLGVFVYVCVGIGFRMSKFWQISFWCSPIVCGLWLVEICFGVRWNFSGWALWLFKGWSGRSGVILGVFLVHCVLCCAGGSDSTCWWDLVSIHFFCSCCC